MASDRLFVPKIPPGLTADDLETYFSLFGSISHFLVPVSNPNICYVTYHNPKSLYAALAVPQHQLKGIFFNVVQALPRAAAPLVGEVTRVFINGIPSSASSDALRQCFSAYGEVVDVQYVAPRSFGFVTFANENQAARCLAANPIRFLDVELKVEPAKPKDASFDGSGSEENLRLFVGGVAGDVSEEELRAYFGGFGTVTSCNVHRSKDSADGKTGFAFVTFSNLQEVYSALAVESHVLGGYELRVVEAAPKGQKQAPSSSKEYRLFVDGIPPEMADEELRSYFGNFGAVSVFRPRTQRKGDKAEGKRQQFHFAFVVFHSVQSMAKALVSGPHVLQDVQLTVTRARDREPSAPAPPPPGPGAPAPAPSSSSSNNSTNISGPAVSPPPLNPLLLGLPPAGYDPYSYSRRSSAPLVPLSLGLGYGPLLGALAWPGLAAAVPYNPKDARYHPY